MAKRVSRGISELLANVEDAREDKATGEKIVKLPLSRVFPNPNQPRKTFSEESLDELAQSISEHGIIQPLVVKKSGNDYVIVAGERRYRAAMKCNLKTVPAVIRNLDERSTREISLIENLQREDLNAIEEAEAIKELLTIYKISQEELAKKLGKARPSIANAVRLLHLPDSLKQAVREGALSAGHARALLAISNPIHQLNLAQKAMEEGWSVRQMEKEVKYYLKPETRPTKMSETVRTKLSADMRKFVDDMTYVFATKVKLQGSEQKGRIILEYYTNEDLQRIYETIEKLKK